MSVRLYDVIANLNLETKPDEDWVILGPDVASLRTTLYPAAVHDAVTPALDGLLLAALLSTQHDPLSWLKQTAHTMREGATLVIIDWQADSRLDIGPALERRIKRGKLCRWLREIGFKIVKTVNHGLYYGLRAIKGLTSSSAQTAEFVEVARLETLPKNGMKPVRLFGHNIIVANTGREIVAFAQTCPHAEGDLYKGRLRGRNIMCPIHFYIWNVATGRPVQPADEDILHRYPVKIDPATGRVFVAVGPATG